uniref:Uncharacterized protein n=1 Tax=Hyaloperonospora arabidopsidis (strain Emoy2) TaxID=559515 RepID=M4B3E0_HYAAE
MRRGKATSHLVRRVGYKCVIYTHTDKYVLKSSAFTLRTVTNSFTLRTRNKLAVYPPATLPTLPANSYSLYAFLGTRRPNVHRKPIVEDLGVNCILFFWLCGELSYVLEWNR